MSAGTPSVFLRIAGCNLRSGHEEHRASAVCRFCDTDFVGPGGLGGGRFETAEVLTVDVAAQRPAHVTALHFVVCTGGEP